MGGLYSRFMRRGWWAPVAASDSWKHVDGHYVGLYRDKAEEAAREAQHTGSDDHSPIQSDAYTH